MSLSQIPLWAFLSGASGGSFPFQSQHHWSSCTVGVRCDVHMDIRAASVGSLTNRSCDTPPRRESALTDCFVCQNNCQEMFSTGQYGHTHSSEADIGLTCFISGSSFTLFLSCHSRVLLPSVFYISPLPYMLKNDRSGRSRMAMSSSYQIKERLNPKEEEKVFSKSKKATVTQHGICLSFLVDKRKRISLIISSG